MVLQKILVLENLIFLVSTQTGSSLLQSGFGKLLFRITIFNIKLSFSSTFMKDKIKFKSLFCDLTPGFVHLWLSDSLQPMEHIQQG